MGRREVNKTWFRVLESVVISLARGSVDATAIHSHYAHLI
jgi:hypothetical protein